MWAGDVSFDGVASFYAGLTNANNALAGITYRPHRDWNGKDTLSVAADDRGFSTEVRNLYYAVEQLWRRVAKAQLTRSVQGRGSPSCIQLSGMSGVSRLPTDSMCTHMSSRDV